jgi:hypothetical protein
LLIVALAIATLFTSDSPNKLNQGSARRDAKLAASFSIFRTPAETPPQAANQRIKEALDTYKADTVLNPQLARTEQGPLWIFHTARLVCISHRRGTACSRVYWAIKEGVSLGVFDPPDEHRRDLHNFLVQGIAPDEVARVQVLVNNRRQLTVDIRENVFSIEADNPIHIKRLLRG